MAIPTQAGPITSQPLRLLIVEDSPADAELSLAVLRHAGYVITYDLVDSFALYEQALARANCDLILCDHNLTSWTGMDALATVRRTGRDIPFIVVTAVLGDEAAVEYIKQGATDYVLKDRLTRLPSVVDRALREKASREDIARFQDEILRTKIEWELTFDAVPDMVLLLDGECRIQRINCAVTQFTKLELPDLINRRCYEVLSCATQAPPGCPHERMLQTGHEERGEIVDHPRSGLAVEATVSPLWERNGNMRGCVCVLRDITERIQAMDALRRSQTELRALTAQLISAREDEGKRLARELHDDFCQRMAALIMEVAVFRQQLAPLSLPVNDSLQLIEGEIGEFTRDLQQFSHQLHPSILDCGLMAAVRAECAAFSKRHGVATDVLSHNVPDSLPGELSLNVYRIVQESLWNIAKHAHAREVRLNLSVMGGELVLAIEDNGKGFDPDEIKGRGGLGLVSMEERARLIRGNFLVESQPGKGTRVKIRVPIPPQDSGAVRL